MDHDSISLGLHWRHLTARSELEERLELQRVELFHLRLLGRILDAPQVYEILPPLDGPPLKNLQGSETSKMFQMCKIGKIVSFILTRACESWRCAELCSKTREQEVKDVHKLTVPGRNGRNRQHMVYVHRASV